MRNWGQPTAQARPILEMKQPRRPCMTHVVTSACVDHKYQECVAVCPVEAFREADTYLVIDPDECIDCGACIPECPVDAIFADSDVPDEEQAWIERNETESIDAEVAMGDSPVLGA